MKIDTLLDHYHITENPFGAEEARHDPVFDRLIEKDLSHPEFAKVMGRVDQPGTSIVFGEKGSGKTAIRIMLANQIAHHNAEHPDRQVLVVPYDDLNPVLDQLLAACGGSIEATLDELRLEDHQDAILSIAVTRLVNILLGIVSDSPEPTPCPKALKKKIKNLPRQSRVDLAVLAALYDQPQTGSVVSRFGRLRRKLRLGWIEPVPWTWIGASLATLAAVGLGPTLWWLSRTDEQPIWLLPALGVSIAAMLLLWSVWGWMSIRRRMLCMRILTQTPAVNRTPSDLSKMFSNLGTGELSGRALPSSDKAGSESRYQLTRRFVEVLNGLGYAGMVVLVDRVDEPTLVHGRADRMRAIVWPMFDNKFLQQKGVGVKLLLPIELRHLVHRESPAFFEEARLDKQHLVDRLTWSGATLYDICSSRLRACQEPTEAPDSESDSQADSQADKPIQLMDLFQADVSRDAVIDALDQMRQPRDAFKFLYGLIQEHCRLSPEDEPSYKIARITLDNVRRAQAQRVQDLQQGIAPA
jgi:hypothetical protein